MPEALQTRKDPSSLSDCGVADLVAVIFEKDRDELRMKLGLPPSRPYNICLNCGRRYPLPSWLTGANSRFCSPECHYDYCQIPLSCTECGKIFYRLQSQIIYRSNSPRHKQKFWFCSRYCLGKFLGKNYGHGRPHKWDWDKVIELRTQTGWGARRLGKALGISWATISYILRKRR